MNTTFFKHSKAFLLVLFFIIVSNIYGQDCDPCDGVPIQSMTYTTSYSTFNLDYKVCPDGSFEIVNLTSNGARIGGSLLLIDAINNFFKVNRTANAIRIPATCSKWQRISDIPITVGDASAEYRLVSCFEFREGCCIFPRSSQGLLQDLTTQAPMCGEDCFETCLF